MIYSNLHTHTTYSDGRHTVRENIESAIKKNMISIGFSDHSYTDFDLTYCIKKEAVASYIEEIKRLREEYADRIEVYIGLELDGYSTLDNRGDFDYFIGDCHYVPTPDGRRSVDNNERTFVEIGEKYFGGDYISFAKKYYETYAERIALIRPDVLGHFDLVTKFGYIDQSLPAYRAAALEALVASLEVCPIVEMNTGAIARGLRREPYPADFLLDEIKARGGKIVLSSDSHHADNLIFAFDECREILRAHGFDSIVALNEGRFKEFGI